MLIAKVIDNIVKKDIKIIKLNSIFKRKIYSLEPIITKKILLKLKSIILLLKLLRKNQN